MYCSNCGHPVNEGNYCINCGARLPGNIGSAANDSGAIPRQNSSIPSTVIKEKSCDGLFEKGELNTIAKWLPGAKIGAELIKMISGGLWIAGKIILYTDALEFKPHKTNTWLATGELAWRIPLVDVQDIDTKWGLGARIITIKTATGSIKVRCLGAESFVTLINNQRKMR